MKRFHVHVAVADLDQSVRFYSTLFAIEPTVLKSDYAKWMLEDPRVNFAISTHSGSAPGVDHLGIQVKAEGPVVEEGKTTCCYAQSEKSWIADPQGVSWETFLTTGESTVYGTTGPQVGARVKSARPEPARPATACCGPNAA